MKKSTVKKPLRLATQIVRTLTVGQLDVVGGGLVAPSRANALSCGSNRCDEPV